MFTTICVVKNWRRDDSEKPPPVVWSNCLMNECVVPVACVALSLCASRLHKWVTKSNRQMVHLSSGTPARVRSFLRSNATGLHRGFPWHSSCTTYCFTLPPLIMQAEGQNKGGGYCGCVCACVCICMCVCVCVCGCALRVGGGRVKKKKKKEEVLSGTEAFCRCCGEGGVNGKFCGYQSRGALWLEEVCHMRPHPDSVSLLVWRGDHREVRGKWVTERWDEKIKGKVEGGKERKKRLKNMFTRGGWGWRRSLRFPSWRVSQSGGGWDSLLVPLDVTWGTLISVCLCLSPFLWPSRCLRSL